VNVRKYEEDKLIISSQQLVHDVSLRLLLPQALSRVAIRTVGFAVANRVDHLTG
jgi:hypothetical protein